jgi:cytochrome c5
MKQKFILLIAALVIASMLAAQCGGPPPATQAPPTAAPAVTEAPPTAAPAVTEAPPTAAPAKTEAPAALDGKALVEDRCTKCHDLGRVEAAKKTEDEWKATVERMIGKGTNLNQAEKEAVIKYLAATYPK